MSRDTVLEGLYALAEDQDGFFTTRQATRQGISRVAIAKAEHRGRIHRSSRGVYRLNRYPYSANAMLWEAILWPETRKDIRGVLSHDSALSIHELSDALPTKVHITLPQNFRLYRETPAWLIIHNADLQSNEIEIVKGLPVTTTFRTLDDIAKTHSPAVLASAVRDAQRKGIPVPQHLNTR